AYWSAHLRQPVKFAEGIGAMGEAGASVFWELGPKPELSVLGRQVLGPEQGVWLTTLRPGVGAHRELLGSVARYYGEGLGDLNWAGFEAGLGRRIVALPTYPFQRQRYRAESALPSAPLPPAETAAPDPIFTHPLFAPTDADAWPSRLGA
ncbi:MAG: hypothetical protein ACRDJK_08955, partial [Actinomycetota bacterium]